MEIAGTRPDWRTRLAPDSPVIGAELVLAARKEMALTLADAVIRRTPLGALGHPGDAALARAAAIVGAELGWSDERRQQEIAAVDAFYRRWLRTLLFYRGDREARRETQRTNVFSATSRRSLRSPR